MDIRGLRPVGISMGCPVGIGPEIVCRYFSLDIERPPAVVLGDEAVMAGVCARLGLDLKIVPWRPGQQEGPKILPFLNPGPRLDPDGLRWGRPTPETGRAMVAWIREGLRLIGQGRLSALATGPITKTGLRMAGFSWPGHTEMLAEWTGSRRFRMMMSGERLKVVLVTIHEPLSRVPSLLSRERIRDCLAMTGHSLVQDFGIARPRIAVAGLNPHAGEGGMFGAEEEELILPALTTYRGPGTVSGPWPPDTVFHRAARGGFDAVVAMYHDQGLIPFKLLHFRDGVNVTLGLPLVRTSVDHGTGYDIAGQGLADPASLAAAVETAARIVINRRRNRNAQGAADRL